MSVESTGRTVEEAIDKGLGRLGIERRNAEVEIIDEPSSGFLGIIGGKPAVVKVSKKLQPDKMAQDFLEHLLLKMDIIGKVHVNDYQKGEIQLEITGDNLGLLIGKRGQTLDSIQFLVNLYLRQQLGKGYNIIIDAENYRKRRKQTLEDLAENLAKKVVRTNKPVQLEPMNKYERRIIHTTLQHNKKVKTYSEGNEPYRKVIINLNK